MVYDGAMLHVRVNGPGMDHVKSVKLDIDEETAKKLGDALSILNKQFNSSEFFGWVSRGYHN
jgi:hypothetical protein